MDRPRVIVHVLAAADGRIALTGEQPLMFEPSTSLWAAATSGAPDVMADLIADHRPGVILNGCGSFVRPGERAFVGPPGDLTERPPATDKTWFTVIDSTGRVRWSYFGDEHTDLLVLVCRSTPAAYLDFLREKNIAHLVVGEDRVELDLAMRRLHDEFGVRCVIADGGGGLTAALLRGGLIDELWLTIAPILIGGIHTPSVVDGPPLRIGEAPRSVRLHSCNVMNDFIVTHYVIK